MNTTKEPQITDDLKRELDQYLKELKDLEDGITNNETVCIQTQKESLDLAINTGEIVARIKNRLPYGMWGKWVQRNTNFDTKTADRRILLWTHKSKLKNCKSISQGYKRIQHYEDERKESVTLTPEQVRMIQPTDYKTRLSEAKTIVKEIYKDIFKTSGVEWRFTEWDYANGSLRFREQCKRLFDNLDRENLVVYTLPSLNITKEDEIKLKVSVMRDLFLTEILLANKPCRFVEVRNN